MRKFLLSLLLTLITITSFSQLTLFGNAYLLFTAYNDGTELIWNKYPIKCDILVQIQDQKLTIYSNETQVYRIITLNYREEDMSQYLAVNDNGIKCYVYLGRYGESGDIGVTIEFSDLAWLYVISPED
jgi:hypothetical protein